MVPGRLGWRMPAEWEAHEATWLAWPHHHADWPGKFATIPWVYAEIVRHLHTGEKVHILVNDAAHEKRARRVLSKAAVDFQQIHFFPIATDRVWTRDYGPLFLVSDRGETALTNWRFNAWAKYPNWQKDDAVGAQLAALLHMSQWQPALGDRRIILEGGSIDVNGAGMLLSTEECLLSDVQARNPGLGRAELEQIFADYLGVRKTLWLGAGIAGDDTHGHVDDLARFVDPRTLVAVSETNENDENFLPLKENWQRLTAFTDQEDRKLETIALPMPEPVIFAGRRLPASYANFYVANDKVLVPTFNDPQDREALGILGELFPSRAVVGIHAVDLVWGLGTLHCMTQQQPRATLAR
jgi:agmatine deiminase